MALFGIYAALDVINAMLMLMSIPRSALTLPKLSFGTIVMAVYAGINEEIIDRGIPMAVMMRNKPDSRRIRLTVVITALFFSLTHIINVAGGQDLATTVIQVVFALGVGLFFAGIYLRTGSIVVTIVIHVLHDLLALGFSSVLVSELDNGWVIGLTSMVSQLLPFVFGFMMLRKKHHQGIINTWTTIWPETVECRGDLTEADLTDVGNGPQLYREVE